MTSSKVVIVGAGVAGITAAACLIEGGIKDVLVLEAQDYVGGRVQAEVVDGHSVELGAQYVHGRVCNPAYDIVRRCGLAHSAQPGNKCDVFNLPEVFLTPHGETIPVKENMDSMLSYLSTKLDKDFKEDIPVEDSCSGESEGDLYEAAFAEHLSQLRDGDDKILFEAIYRWFKMYQIVDTASADLSDLSIYALYKYKVLDGPRDTYVSGGMSAILKKIKSLVPDEKIHLNTHVENIDWSNAGTSSKVLVKCLNGKEISADYVIVTVSIGYLQAKHNALFTPALPPAVQSAIDHIGFGGVGKIFLRWEKPFVGYTQTEGVQIYEVLWLPNRLVQLKHDRSGRKTQKGEPWWYGIHSLETVYECPNVLEMWLGKEEATIAEELEDSEILEICYELVQLIFYKFTVPKPCAVYRTKWISNPYIRGTYSFLSTNIRAADLSILGQPVPSSENPKVLFAGEGFADEFISTFHGAHLSGQKNANAILQKENKGPVCLVDRLPTNQTQG